MKKVIFKTESFSEFVARGGKVTKCPTKHAPKKYSRKLSDGVAVDLKSVDMSVIPTALKISLGIK